MVELPEGIISDILIVLLPVKSITLAVAPEVAPVTNSSTANVVPFQELTTAAVAWSTTDVFAKSPFENLGCARSPTLRKSLSVVKLLDSEYSSLELTRIKKPPNS